MVVDSINAATVVSATKRVAQYLVDTTLSRAKKIQRWCSVYHNGVCFKAISGQWVV